MAFIKFTSPIPALEASFRMEGNVAVLTFFGTLEDELSAEKVSAEFQQFHAQLVAAKVTSVRLSIKGMGYMNSGALKAFGSWFSRAENNGKPQYFIEAHYDPQSSWQGWSMGVFQRMAPNALRLVPPRRLVAPTT